MRKTSQRHFLITTTLTPIVFDRKSGGRVSADASKRWDAGSRKTVTRTSRPTADDLVITVDYDPLTHQAEARRLAKLVAIAEGSVSVQDLTVDDVPFGEPQVYPEALLIDVNFPEADNNSSDPGDFSLTFSTDVPA